MKKVLSLSFFFLALTLFVLVTIADNAYPQGESYLTGRMVANDRDNSLIVRDYPEYAQLPSPSSNPSWVRFVQSGDGPLLVLGFAGLIAAYAYWPKRYTVKNGRI